jgi:transcriptional regulator with XRE-family HTH domain
MTGGSPIAQRRRLGRLLRSLREQVGRTGEDAAAAVERSASWLSRIESGQSALRLRELRDLLQLYGLTDQARITELEGLANAGRQRGWWSRYGDVIPGAFARYIGLEADAIAISTFEDRVIPGLLQSPGYMRALFALGVPPPPAEVVESRVEIRTKRQELLRRAGRPRFTLILDEAVLRRRIGGEPVAREQLAFLLDAIEQEQVELQILTFEGGEVMPLHAFTVLRFDDDPAVVYIDTLTGGVWEEGNTVAGTYEKIFDYIRTIALPPQASRQYIQAAKDALE